MTIEDLANYCQFKNCTVRFGTSEAGTLDVDGGGLRQSFNAYRRFLAHNELSKLPRAHRLLSEAITFQIEDKNGRRDLDRAAFEEELTRFKALIGE